MYVPVTRPTRVRVPARAETTGRRAVWSSFLTAAGLRLVGAGFVRPALAEAPQEAEGPGTDNDAVKAALARCQYCLRRRGMAACHGSDRPCTELESLAEEGGKGGAKSGQRFGSRALKESDLTPKPEDLGREAVRAWKLSSP